MEEFDKYVSIEIRTTQTKADKEAYRTGKAVFVPGPSKFGKDKKNSFMDVRIAFYIKITCSSLQNFP